MVQVPLVLDVESGVNEMLDRDGSRTPIQFHISDDRGKHPIDAQVVRAVTRWKRVALKQFSCRSAKASALNARRPQETTSSTTITQPMSISGIGSVSSMRSIVISSF